MNMRFCCAQTTKRILLLAASALAAYLVFGGSALSESVDVTDLDQLQMGMGLFGGLALFLFGMEQMGDGLKAAAGDRMKGILAGLTRTRVHAAMTGAIVTAVIQSSSVTTVLVVGFISAGLMSLTQSVGIIMGANIGTTVTAQIVAFRVEEAALAMIAVGFAWLYLAKQDRLKHYGGILMGLGLVFFGMGVMSDAMAPLRTYDPFLELMAKMDRPFLAILVAATFTALVQSSSATTGIVIVMASQGFVTLEAGIALAFGANVGTCITAMLAALGKTPEAVRAAIVHVLFNVIGVLLWLAFIPQLASMTVELSPVHSDLVGVAKLAAETPRQIANANTLFNAVNTVVFLGFTGVFARVATACVKDRPVDERLLVQPKFLDEELVSTPALALERVQLEIGHLGETVIDMFEKIPDVMSSRNEQQLATLAQMDDRVDLLQGRIVSYLGKVRQRNLSEVDSDNFVKLMHATDNLESIGDVIETNFVSIGHQLIEQQVRASETMRLMLTELHQVVGRGLVLAVQAVRDNDERAAHEVVTLKGEVDRRIEEALAHQAGKLSEDDHRIAIFRLEMEVLDELKHVHTLSKRIAKGVLPHELAAKVV